MRFGKVWRQSDASFWDGMWAKHKDSLMTKRLLAQAMAAESICEVGCGFGHFLQALIDQGWRGRFVGFEMSPDGVLKVRERCRKAGIEYEVFAGDFLESLLLFLESDSSPCELSLCRGVVQHQSHWMPMTLGMLRVAPKALVGIGYVAASDFHSGPLRPQGHYDVQISLGMLEREARCVGLDVELAQFRNPVRKCDEALATFSHTSPV